MEKKNSQWPKSSGNTHTSGTLDVDGQSTLASANIEDLTSGRVVLAGTSGELEDSANLTFNGSLLTVTGDTTATGDLTVQGDLTQLNVSTLNVEDKNLLIASGAVDSLQPMVVELQSMEQMQQSYIHLQMIHSN